MNAQKNPSKPGRSQPRSFPDAFGRFTAIGSQHQELGATVAELRRMCDALQSGDAEPTRHFAAVTLLSNWRAELMVHFSTEESGSYFGVVAADRPELIAKIAELRADHTAMLETMDQLVTLATELTPGWNLGQQIDALIQRFLAHEQTESTLAQDYFQGNE
jgi:iron-sulfur cluster repair protein YtfE (RIC family)